MTIEELASEFENWRNNRKREKEPIPLRLWKQAIKVAEETSPTKVAQSCNIAISKINRRMAVKQKPTPKVKFNKVIPSQTARIELTTSSGIQLKIY